MKLSKLSVYNVTRFSLRPPEFIYLFDKLSDFYRWFSIGIKKMVIGKFPDSITVYMRETYWIEGLQSQVLVRKIELLEIITR